MNFITLQTWFNQNCLAAKENTFTFAFAKRKK